MGIFCRYIINSCITVQGYKVYAEVIYKRILGDRHQSIYK